MAISKIQYNPIVVESGYNTKAFYRKWSDGTLEQWSRGVMATGASSGNVQTSIAFPIPFLDTTYALMVLGQSNVISGTTIAENQYSNGSANRTVNSTQISFYKTGNAYAQYFSWYAIGKWK